jgi:hypothetical protein
MKTRKSFHDWPVAAQVALVWPAFMAAWAAFVALLLFAAKVFRTARR